jgi:hypothetical protein
MALISGISSVLGLLRRAFWRCSQRQHLLTLDHSDDHALPAAFFARHDSNSGSRHVQTFGEQLHKRFVCTIVHRRRGEMEFQGVHVLACDRVATRLWLYVHVKGHASGGAALSILFRDILGAYFGACQARSRVQNL